MLEVTYPVKCPRDFGAVYDMTIRLVKLEDGSHLPSPCNGCDNLSGAKQCKDCIESLFKMSLKDPTMKSYQKPITPQTEK